MSDNHLGGNIQPGLDLEEHDGINNAKRVTLVSVSGATIYAVVNTSGNTLGSRATYANISLTSIGTMILASDTLRRSILVRNISTATIFIGASSIVTTSTGIPLKTDDALTLDQYDGDVYGVADATGHSIRFVAELD